MAGDTIDQLLTSIRQKEAELLLQEETYLAQKLKFDRRAQDLDERKHRLAVFLGQERDKMKNFLSRYDKIPDAVSDFYAQLQDLEDESDRTHRQKHQELKEAKEQSSRSYRQEKDRIETELSKLWRTYNELDN